MGNFQAKLLAWVSQLTTSVGGKAEGGGAVIGMQTFCMDGCPS